MPHTQLPWKSDFEFSEDYYHAGYSIDGIDANVATDMGEIEDVKFILQACNNYYKYHAAMDMARTLLCQLSVKQIGMTDEIYCVLEKLDECLGIKWRKWDIAAMVAQSEQIKEENKNAPL